MAIRNLCSLLLVATGIALLAANKGSRAEYAGGTIAQIPDGCSGSIQAIDQEFFVFYAKRHAGACHTKKSISSNMGREWIADTWPPHWCHRFSYSAKGGSIFLRSVIPMKTGISRP